MVSKKHNELGFTLVELLVTMSIIGILSGISIQSWNVYRDKAYNIAADELLHNARVALHAGRGNTDELATDFYWASSDSSGQFTAGDDVNIFAPGISVEPDTRLVVWFNGFCEAAMSSGACPINADCCIMESMMAWHCKGSTVKQHLVWNSGTVSDFEMVSWGC